MPQWQVRWLVEDLARRLEERYPSAVESVREGLDEALTLLEVSVSDPLRRALAITNIIESLVSRLRHVQENVDVGPTVT